MKNLVLTFLLFFTFCVKKSQCQTFDGTPVNIINAIYGGNPTNISNAPFIVSLDIIGQNCKYDHACGGSIINNEWILTAAHCVDQNTIAGDITVHAGATNHTLDVGQRILVDRIIIHEDWNPASPFVGNDMALLHLSTPLCFNSNIQPIPYITNDMPEELTVPGTAVKIYGWGRTAVWADECEENLRFANTNVISNTDAELLLRPCHADWEPPFVIELSDNLISFFYDPGNSPWPAAGQYDSGGPAVINHNNSPLLIGVTSWGCGLHKAPSIYSRVKNYTDFISSNTTLSDLVISSDKLISENEEFSTDIQIVNGATLTITSEVKILKGKSIYVDPQSKLVIDGGKITSLCEENWRQIFNKGEVVLTNGATIENANIGILCFGQVGARITSDGAAFVNNGTGISIIKSNTVMNLESTTFSGGDYGVYLDRSKTAPTFNNCSFSYHSKNGIHAISSVIDVQNGNSFVGCDNGIAVSNLVGNNTTSNIGIDNNSSANTFTNNSKGLYAINSDLKISNNVVDNNAFGLYYSGQNIFSSVKNTFDGSSYAEGLYSTGTNSNFSNDNIYNSDVGIFPWQRNDRYKFSDNCFSTTWWDVNAPNGTQINVAQGSVNYAASNCFTKIGVPDFICETVDRIIYNVPSDPTAPLCMFPTNPGEGTPQGNYKTNKVDNYDINGCGGANLGSPNEYQYIINVGCDSVKLKKIIDSLKVKITAFKSKPKPLSEIDKWKLYFNEHHLVFALQQKAWCLRKKGKKGQLKDLYIEWATLFPTESYPRIKSAEVSYELGNTSQAHIELNNLAASLPSKQNAIAAIKLSMDVMTIIDAQVSPSVEQFSTTPPYNLTSSQYNLLVNVATSNDPDAAYGRALLGYLTGQYLEPNISFPITPRSRHEVIAQEKEIVKSSPNPTSDWLNVTIDNIDTNSKYHFGLIDINGRQVIKGQLQNANQLDMSTLSNGIYILKVTKNNLSINHLKIIIQK